MIDRLSELAKDLRDRRAVRYLLAYLVGAWVAIQAVGFYVEQGYIGRTALDATLFLAAIGLTATAVAVWNHGEAGAQPVARGERVIYSHGAPTDSSA